MGDGADRFAETSPSGGGGLDHESSGRENLGTRSPMNGRRGLRPQPLMACAAPLAAFMAELDAALGNGSQIGSTVVRDPTLRLPAADQIR